MTTTNTNAASWPMIAAAVGADLAPGVRARDEAGSLPAEVFDALRAAGLTTALVPRELGGGGATHAEMGAALRELARYDAPTAVALSMHTHLVAAQVWRHHRELPAPALPKVVDGAVLVSTGASDWVSSNGTARAVEGGFRVTARKSPASACEVGTILVTSIRWDEAPDEPQVIHCSVPFSADGVRIEHTWDTLGMRGTGSHTVVLEDVFVPEAAVALVRPADRWHPVWNVVMGAAMPLIVAAYLGIADAALDEARDVAKGRTQPHLVPLLGELVTAHTTAVDAVTGMFAEAQDLRFDNTDDLSARVLARKTVATEAMVRTVRLAVEVAGGRGYTRGAKLEQMLRDVHAAQFHPLPAAQQLQFTGRVALGLDPVT